MSEANAPQGFQVLQKFPIFSLTTPIPAPVDFKKALKGFQLERLPLLDKAQIARDTLIDHLQQRIDMEVRLADLDNYFPIALRLESEISSNPSIQPDPKHRISWVQSPIVVHPYDKRGFSPRFFSVEILHLIWLKGTLLLNQGYLASEAQNFDVAVAKFRELAGVFTYLQTDRLRNIGGDAVPFEFQQQVLQSLTLMALSQAYVIIAIKAEKDNLKSSSLSRLCYAIHNTLNGAAEAMQGISHPEAFNNQYVDFMKASALFYGGASAVYCSFAQKANGQTGKAISLIRNGIKKWETAKSMPKVNERIKEAVKAVLEKATALEKQWTDENVMVSGEAVPEDQDAETIIAQYCTTLPTLPQSIQFNLPDPLS